jgi:hypothetical protein
MRFKGHLSRRDGYLTGELLNLTSSPPQAARIPTESDFSPISSVGSSHNRLTSAEDNEKALLLGYPPIGLVDRKNI